MENKYLSGYAGYNFPGRLPPAVGPTARRVQNVLEEVRDADGNHQALLLLSGDGGKLAADGAVRRKTFNRYGTGRQAKGLQDGLSTEGIGTLFRASQFLSEELPIRLAHRVQELGDLPDGLNEMTSIKRVQDWYAQSFEV